MLDPEDMKKIREQTSNFKSSKSPEEVRQTDEVIKRLGDATTPLLAPLKIGFSIDQDFGEFLLSSVITSLIMAFCSVDEAMHILEKSKDFIKDIDKLVNK